MKIIKKGKIPDDTFQGKCSKCDSVIQADRKELQVEYDQRENGEFGRGSCPVCMYRMIFYPKGPK